MSNEPTQETIRAQAAELKKKVVPCFQGGQIVITRQAMETLDEASTREALRRHFRGDWGDCCPSDAYLNDEALVTGETRKFSSYKDRNGVKFWIITEWDGSVTTVLLPEDY